MSLSMVLGSVTMFMPASASSLALFCVPFPPITTRQSRLSRLYVSSMAGMRSLPSSSTMAFPGMYFWREVPSMVPPSTSMPEKSFFSMNL